MTLSSRQRGEGKGQGRWGGRGGEPGCHIEGGDGAGGGIEKGR